MRALSPYNMAHPPPSSITLFSDLPSWHPHPPLKAISICLWTWMPHPQKPHQVVPLKPPISTHPPLWVGNRFSWRLIRLRLSDFGLLKTQNSVLILSRLNWQYHPFAIELTSNRKNKVTSVLAMKRRRPQSTGKKSMKPSIILKGQHTSFASSANGTAYIPTLIPISPQALSRNILTDAPRIKTKSNPKRSTFLPTSLHIS